VLQDSGSDGKTTLLDYVHQKLGGVRIGMREFLFELAAYELSAIEGAFLDLIDAEIEQDNLVIVDDLHLIKNVVESGCLGVYATESQPLAIRREGPRRLQLLFLNQWLRLACAVGSCPEYYAQSPPEQDLPPVGIPDRGEVSCTAEGYTCHHVPQGLRRIGFLHPTANHLGVVLEVSIFVVAAQHSC